MSSSLMAFQMSLVISSPSSSATGLLTFILLPYIILQRYVYTRISNQLFLLFLTKSSTFYIYFYIFMKKGNIFADDHKVYKILN